MKRKNIDWKLAVVCPLAALVLSGCYNRYPNVIEDVSKDKMLIKDVKDGKERMIDFRQKCWNTSEKNWLAKRINFSKKGDTIIVKQEKIIDYYGSKCLFLGPAEIKFDEDLIAQRQQEHVFDSLKCVMLHENQGLQK